MLQFLALQKKIKLLLLENPINIGSPYDGTAEILKDNPTRIKIIPKTLPNSSEPYLMKLHQS